MLDSNSIIQLNKKIFLDGGNLFQCIDAGKVDSAICAAFYPGSPPYQHGGVAEVAGALAFYLCQAHAFCDGNKRTASVASLVYLKKNNFDLSYKSTNIKDEFSDVIISVAGGGIPIDELKLWFKNHAVNSF